MKTIALFIWLFCALRATVHAGPRASTNFSIPAESIDPAGARTQSASYRNDSSVGGVTGISSVASPAETAKHGYVGQLYDIVGVSITAPPSTSLNEGATRQLFASPLADDATTLAALNPSTVAWSVVSGSIASISGSGVATAGTVYQDTPGTVAGTVQGLSGQLNLSILNISNDNFGAYAGDSIDDQWQVQYFGQPPNALAGANADPDGDGGNNLFEFTAGLVPNDANSRFVLSIHSVAGQPGQKNIVFNPLVSGRTYNVQFRPNLAVGDWSALTTTTQSDTGNQRTVTDTNALTAPKFYRVQISKP